jgi:hypothetical protein
MGFDDPVKIHPSWQKIKQGDHEFLWQVGDRLTMIPITPPKNYSWLRKLWLQYAPEFWKRHKRHRSHLKFLDNVGVTDKDGRKYFGTDGHIATEKVRVTRLPPIEYNDFDPRRRTSTERRNTLRAIIRRAIDDNRPDNPA